jgi:hypothetical protein
VDRRLLDGCRRYSCGSATSRRSRRSSSPLRRPQRPRFMCYSTNASAGEKQRRNYETRRGARETGGHQARGGVRSRDTARPAAAIQTFGAAAVLTAASGASVGRCPGAQIIDTDDVQQLRPGAQRAPARSAASNCLSHRALDDSVPHNAKRTQLAPAHDCFPRGHAVELATAFGNEGGVSALIGGRALCHASSGCG